MVEEITVRWQFRDATPRIVHGVQCWIYVYKYQTEIFDTFNWFFQFPSVRKQYIFSYLLSYSIHTQIAEGTRNKLLFYFWGCTETFDRYCIMGNILKFPILITIGVTGADWQLRWLPQNSFLPSYKLHKIKKIVSSLVSWCGSMIDTAYRKEKI